MAARKNFSTGQIINALRKAEVGIANGKAIKDVCRELGVSEQRYYRWRREYGGMKASQAKRLKDLEKENARLKRRSRDAAEWELIRTRAKLGEVTMRMALASELLE